MNLALEAIIRNKAIQNLFQTPTTIGVQNKSKQYMWIILESLDQKVKVSQWNLNLFEETKSFNLELDEIFEPKKVIPPGFYPIKFLSVSVDSEMNTYKSPMSKESYEEFHLKMLRPEDHIKYKKFWLWDAFIKYKKFQLNDRSSIDYSLMCGDTWSFMYEVEEEMYNHEILSPDLFKEWSMYFNKLMIQEKFIPGELMFASLFSINHICE